jgi:hypothetical protein
MEALILLLRTDFIKSSLHNCVICNWAQCGMLFLLILLLLFVNLSVLLWTKIVLFYFWTDFLHYKNVTLGL